MRSLHGISFVVAVFPLHFDKVVKIPRISTAIRQAGPKHGPANWRRSQSLHACYRLHVVSTETPDCAGHFEIKLPPEICDVSCGTKPNVAGGAAGFESLSVLDWGRGLACFSKVDNSVGFPQHFVPSLYARHVFFQRVADSAVQVMAGCIDS
jgi:hypothetical protein